jgi:hypothetical protein
MASFFKSYLKPKAAAKNQNSSPDAATSAAVDMAQLRTVTSQTGSGFGPHNWAPHQGYASTASDGVSQPSSLYPEGDFRNNDPDAIRNIKCEVMVNWLHSKQEENIWTTGEMGEGVVLKKSKGRYVCCPGELQHDTSNFYQSIATLNVRVCI